MIHVTCPSCSQTDQVHENLAGQVAKCRHCGHETPIPGVTVPGSLTERLKQAAGRAKSTIGGLTRRVGAAVGNHAGNLIQRVRGNRPPLVSAAVLYKVGLGAAWAAGAPEEAEVLQITEWLDSQLPEIAACIKEMHPPNQPMGAAAIFQHTQPPQQLDGKVLLLRFVRQFFARSERTSEERQEFLVELERWIGIEADQLASIREQLDAEQELEREPEQLGSSSWTLAGLWRDTSACAAAGGVFVIGQTARFSHYLGEKAVAGWTSLGDVPKPLKIAVVTAAAGGTVVASPFLLAALSTTSIVSILATLGGGAIAVGGYGVAGGVAVLILSCATTSTLSALLAANLIKDPEVEKLIMALRDVHALVEKSKQVSASQLDRLRQYDAAVKKLILEKNVLSTEVVLLRGKIEAMRDELQGGDCGGVEP